MVDVLYGTILSEAVSSPPLIYQKLTSKFDSRHEYKTLFSLGKYLVHCVF